MMTWANLSLVLLLLLAAATVQAQNCGTSRRRPWRSLSCGEQDEYLNAVQALKDSGGYDAIARVHWQTGAAAHNRPEFLPWHRYYLWIFERELQRASNSCITVPFWDWERGDIGNIFRANSFGSRQGGCVRDGIAADWNGGGGGCLTRGFNNGISLTRDVEVLSRITNQRTFAAFSMELEGAPHASVHQFVGGTMTNTLSSSDPIFWLHHSNVDRIWALWQNYHGHHSVNPDNYQAEHYSQNLNTRLVIRGDDRGIFDSPTVRDVLSNQGLVRVQYVDDNLARNIVQTSGRQLNQDWNVPRLAADQCNGNNNPGGNNNDNGNPQGPPDNDPEPDCQENTQGCGRDEHCCSGNCQGNVCRAENQQPEPDCQEDNRGCGRDEHCCSGNCQGNVCRAENQQPQCREVSEQCGRDNQCCSDNCQGNVCRPELQQAQESCAEEPERCLRNRECCSGRCDGGRCRGNGNNGDEDEPQQGREQDCLSLFQGCTSGRDCCSGRCQGRVCMERPQEQLICQQDGESCNSGRDCCMGRCGNGVCRDPIASNENQRQTCATQNQRCNGNSECCSRRCDRNSRVCLRSRNNFLRRTTAEDEHEEIEPRQGSIDVHAGFSSSGLDARWYELVGLYGTNSPDIVFSTMGREDCDNREREAGRPIQSASLEYIKSVSALNIDVVHTYDCHCLPGETYH